MILSIDSNETNADNGSYPIIKFFNMGQLRNKPIISKIKIKVSGGLIDIASLIKASEDINKQTDYSGQFIDSVNFNHKLKAFDVFIGS